MAHNNLPLPPVSRGFLFFQVIAKRRDFSPPEAALAYKGLWRIEHAFRELKSGLQISPIFLRTEVHVRAHIMVCFLAQVTEATLQRSQFVF